MQQVKHEPKMLFPEVKDEIRMKLKADYDAHEAGKDGKLGYEAASASLLRQVL